MLGYEPWLNTTTGCRFPLPFFDNLDEFPKPRDFQTDAPTIKKPSKPVKLSRKFLKQNEGLFGNFGYGNISVSLSKCGAWLRILVSRSDVLEFHSSHLT